MSWFRYCPPHLLEWALSHGWQLVDHSPDHHSAYSVFIEWAGEGDPVWIDEAA